MPVLRIPTPLRTYTNGQSDVIVNGSNISDALTDLTAQYPAQNGEKILLIPSIAGGQDARSHA